jgi:hypothetical protein
VATTDGGERMIVLPHRRKAFRGGGAFDPTSIAGLELWLDAADSTTLFDATSGGSLPGDAGNVKRWEDKSGNARHATEATNCPIRKTGIQNGLDVVRFSFSPRKYLTTAAFGGFNSFDCYVVATGFSSPQGEQFGRLVACPNFDIIRSYWDSDGTMITETPSWTVGLTPNVKVPLDVSLIMVNIKGNHGSPGTRSFSLNQGNTTIGTPTSTDPGSGIFKINARADNIQSSGGDFCEIVYYNSLLGTSDREAVESYLMTKWGI